MHPALSVIFFTVSSGAGFGMMTWIGIGAALPVSAVEAFLTCTIAAGLAVAGLVSSTFHLGHPERAWRAFSQWRSSWLSREGVCAVATLLAFAAYGASWVFLDDRIDWLGWFVALGSVLTVFTTSMIYAQLKTIPAWNTWLTPACYLLFSLASGLFLVAGFGQLQSILSIPTGAVCFLLLLAAWLIKGFWWKRNQDNQFGIPNSTTGTATGLGEMGDVRLLEKPHSGENYLTREMVHVIGRKHAEKLRKISILFGALVPVICLLPVITGSDYPSLFVLAALSMIFGLLVERWLFFAEAKHTVSLYY